jgi:uncharacterized protein YchJ
MRSRWTAFALGLGEYLWTTLAEGHPDRAAPRERAIVELSRAKDRQRFLRLSVLHAATVPADDAEGEVLFHARIFARGQDVSFAELSRFVREAAGWRYASGILVPRERLPEDPTGLDRDRFLALAGSAVR